MRQPWLPVHPDCPNCDEEVTQDTADSWDCDGCGMSWTLEGDPAGFFTELYPSQFTRCPQDGCRLIEDHRGECIT